MGILRRLRPPTCVDVPDSSPPGVPTGQRRQFLKQSLTVVGCSAAAGTLGIVALRRRKDAEGVLLAPVTTLDAVPADGRPREFFVHANRLETWNELFGKPAGTVFLRRTAEGVLKAFNGACPHAGCRVRFEAQRGGYLCPCHKSTFTVEGKLADPKSEALRGLDELRVEVRNETEVWVAFQDFFPGHAEKYPVL